MFKRTRISRITRTAGRAIACATCGSYAISKDNTSARIDLRDLWFVFSKKKRHILPDTNNYEYKYG